jgi:crotonobetainyl-CoA:carnitine CoA-transferase CaiB-like acyl-CoA transferase
MGPPFYPRAISRDRRPYRTRDGYISVLVYTDRHWKRFFEAIGNPDWSREPCFASLTARTHAIEHVLGKLADTLAQRTNAEWLELLRKVEIPCMPLFSTADLLHDPHLEAVGFWQEMDTKEGRMRFPGIPTWFSATPGRITEAGPGLGEHSRAVLEEYGFGADEIDRLTTPAKPAAKGE